MTTWESSMGSTEPSDDYLYHLGGHRLALYLDKLGNRLSKGSRLGLVRCVRFSVGAWSTLKRTQRTLGSPYNRRRVITTPARRVRASEPKAIPSDVGRVVGAVREPPLRARPHRYTGWLTSQPHLGCLRIVSGINGLAHHGCGMMGFNDEFVSAGGIAEAIAQVA